MRKLWKFFLWGTTEVPFPKTANKLPWRRNFKKHSWNTEVHWMPNPLYNKIYYLIKTYNLKRKWLKQSPGVPKRFSTIKPRRIISPVLWGQCVYNLWVFQRPKPFINFHQMFRKCLPLKDLQKMFPCQHCKGFVVWNCEPQKDLELNRFGQ